MKESFIAKVLQAKLARNKSEEFDPTILIPGTTYQTQRTIQGVHKEALRDLVQRDFRPTEGELTKINQFTLKQLSKDEVKVFYLEACGDLVDRSSEIIVQETLEAFNDLCLGRAYTCNHDWRTDPKGVIFDAYTEQRTNKEVGKDYTAHVQKIYILDIPENQEEIKNLEAGVYRYVSVSFSILLPKCSICGNDIRSSKCPHIPGWDYDEEDNRVPSGKSGFTCYVELREPEDYYETSRVLLGCQYGAQVVGKSFQDNEPGTKNEKGGKEQMDELEKLKGKVGELEAKVSTLTAEKTSLEGEKAKAAEVLTVIFGEKVAEATVDQAKEVVTLRDAGAKYKQSLVDSIVGKKIFLKEIEEADREKTTEIYSKDSIERLELEEKALKTRMEGKVVPQTKTTGGGTETDLEGVNLDNYKISRKEGAN